MNLKTFIENSTKQLIAQNIESAGIDVKFLVSDYFSYELHDLIINEAQPLEENDIQNLSLRINRRLLGEPVAYILGYKYFYKSKFIVSDKVLIPRPETELLVEQALDWCSDKKKIKILDMGSGSGCLGQSVLKELTGSFLLSLDISAEATKVAKQNAAQLSLSESINFEIKDVNDYAINEYSEEFDLILANPPYIDRSSGFVEKNVKKFEPSIALFSDNNGLKDIISWSERAASWLKPGGLYLMEFGENQYLEIEKIFKQNNFFMDISLHKDYAGLPRYIRAIK